MISTFQRPEACAEAVESALAQDPAPLEVLVCDDGSEDGTRERFTAWGEKDPRVRYVRVAHAGWPAPARNAGVRAARGDWVAFLDDDDRWRAGKLAVQAPHLTPGTVVATNAQRSSGAPYFPDLDAPLAPTRADLLRENLLIASTAIAPRDAILAAGGFPEAAWARGVEDYAVWLRLAQAGARFVVLPDVTTDYSDHPAGRLSTAPLRQELGVARLAWSQWLARPSDRVALGAAVGHSRSVERVARGALVARLRRRLPS
ncbi:MAG: hypothetical protein QOG63_2938 [Thermoleophilaceae bacterium]|nr:hypothetical protein [Thermoleophilaceae bacterium]